MFISNMLNYPMHFLLLGIFNLGLDLGLGLDLELRTWAYQLIYAQSNSALHYNTRKKYNRKIECLFQSESFFDSQKANLERREVAFNGLSN